MKGASNFIAVVIFTFFSVIAVLFLVTPLIFFVILSRSANSEDQDYAMMNYQNDACRAIFQFYFEKNKFPNSLEEINTSPTYQVAPGKFFTMKYSLAKDGKSFYLASKVNTDFVVYLQAPKDEEGLDKEKKEVLGGTCSSSLGFEEGYDGKRIGFPIYRTTNPPFEKPEEWPQL